MDSWAWKIILTNAIVFEVFSVIALSGTISLVLNTKDVVSGEEDDPIERLAR
jgi:hypothetical protein